MVLTGIAYNVGAKWRPEAPLFLGSWMFGLTATGFLFFASPSTTLLVVLAFVGFMQLWIQWFEGLLKDHDQAFWDRALRWDKVMVLWSFKGLQVIFLALLFALFQPWTPWGYFPVALICFSGIIWFEILECEDRVKLLKLSGLHEIVVYAVVPLCMMSILGVWALLYILLPTAIYFGFNQLLYGTMGRPKI